MLLDRTALTSATAGPWGLHYPSSSLGGPGPFPCTPEAALTNARLGSNPGEPQVENHTPDIEHAADLGGEGGSEATWGLGTPRSNTYIPVPSHGPASST